MLNEYPPKAKNYHHHDITLEYTVVFINLYGMDSRIQRIEDPASLVE
jgi:hypothetical protein